MVAVIQEHENELQQLCERFGVERLEVFGSAAGPDFDPESSDLDFLVQFRRSASGGAADRYFDLLEALEELFERPVDLLEDRAVRNPFFRESIEATRQLLYAA
ncbi:MAG: nucleotidyltransferase domain-containing protein [Acidobacteria bacterium]|nr:nucleotidyltransferase domain-containing protein [Acidobacteriota bacterium]